MPFGTTGTFKLLGKDMAVQIYFGGVQDGTPNYGTAAPYLCTAKSVKISRKADLEDVSGLCDGEKRWRAKKAEGSIILEGCTWSDGYSFADVNGPIIGQYIKVETKEHSGMTAYRVWEGIVEEWDWESGDSLQVERITIRLNPEKAVTA